MDYNKLITGLYINHKSSKDRAKLMQSQIETLNLPYQRFDAIDKSEYQQYKRPQYVANGISHLNILKHFSDSKKHIHILEDDVTFSPSMKTNLSRVIKSLENSEWDIIFTDVIFGLDNNLFELEKYFSIYKTEKKLALLDLQNYISVGAGSYIINKNSINKIYKLINTIDNINSFNVKAYDLQLKDLIISQKIKAITIFPFLTKTSIHSRTSTLEDRNVTWDIASELLREHFYIDSNKEASSNQDLIEYLANIKTTQREELLLNIVKYRYSNQYKPV